MKKLIIFLGLFLVFSLNGCSTPEEIIGDSSQQNTLQTNQTELVTLENTEVSVSPTIQKGNTIEITHPDFNKPLKSPVIIKGQAPGSFFSEGTFPVVLEDANGKEIALAHANAKGDWMTLGLVEFEAKLEFTKPATSEGKLVFQKDNPSGLDENNYGEAFKVSF